MTSEMTALKKKQEHLKSLHMRNEGFEAELYKNSEINPLVERIKALNALKSEIHENINRIKT